MNRSLPLSAACLFFSAAASLGIANAHSLDLESAPAKVTKVDPNDPTKPASVPSNYLVTPYGYFHPSCVQAVATSEQLLADGSILGKDGTLRTVAACHYPSFQRDGTRVEPNDRSMRAAREPTTYNGYLQLVSVVLASGANELTATMTVPPNPSLQSGQTLYFFPGLEDAQDVITILQPVLGWDGFGADNWTITSWNCCKTGTTYYGNSVVVSPGDVILGTMTKEIGQIWSISAKDETNTSLSPATLTTRGYSQSFDWIFAGALETYGVTSCSQFPSSGPIVYADVNIYVNNSLVSSPAWTTQAGTGSPSTCTSATVLNSTTVDIGY